MSAEPTNLFDESVRAAVTAALRQVVAELEEAEEEVATASRDFGRGMAVARRYVEKRAHDCLGGLWP